MADHVLLDEVLEVSLVDLIHDGGRQRQDLASQRQHLLCGIHPSRAGAHQRLVHVEVDEPHLGVRQLGDGLPVDPHELEHRN